MCVRLSHPHSVSLSQPNRVGQLDLDLSAVEGSKHSHHLQQAVVQPAGTHTQDTAAPWWSGCRLLQYETKMDALLPCGGAGFVPHTFPEPTASTPVANVADDDALQAGQLHTLPIQFQLRFTTHTHTHSKQTV